MQIFLNIIFTFSIYSLIGLSFYIIYSTTKYLHFSHAAIITVAPYLFYTLKSNNISFIISIFITLIIVAIIAFIIEKIYKRLKMKNSNEWLILIASIGIYVVIQNLISMIWNDGAISNNFLLKNFSYDICGGYITTIQIMIISISAIIFFTITLFYKYSITGKEMKAVSSNIVLSQIFGINSPRAIRVSFILGSLTAGISGVLISMDIYFTPTTGFHFFLYSVIAMIISGTGKYTNILLGALILATTQHLSAYYIDSKWIDAIAFIFLIVFLYFKPYGLSGHKLKKAKL